jgi:septal ring factor EnvC (AmiA/AmiB activator)
LFIVKNDATEMMVTSLKQTAVALRQPGGKGIDALPLRAATSLQSEPDEAQEHIAETDAQAPPTEAIEKSQPAIEAPETSPIAIATVKDAESKPRDLETEKGKLHPPLIYGRVKDGFGTQMIGRNPRREVRHTGLTITAPSEHRVRNIASGKVVFSDAHRGYGLLVIVDHGGGWHSLYAHLQMVYVKEGQRLGRGAPLGKIGKPHDQPRPAIYFELRKNGVPLDPAGWFDPDARQ